MKASNIIIFVLVIIAVVGIIGYAVWKADTREGADENQLATNETTENLEITEPEAQNEQSGNLIITDPSGNQINTNSTDNNNTSVQLQNYVGDWFVSEETYINAERIDEILDQREDNLITDQEFQKQMESEINNDVAELDVEYYRNGQIRFDFTLTSPAPTQREGKIDDMVVNIDENVGTFTYTDNWGTSGNGTITLGDNQITLKLETTKASQGALWGVEGIYTFSYKRID